MSVNYHAFQSRGVLFSEYEKVCRQWRDAFAGLDPSRLEEVLHLESDPEYLYVDYFRTPYRLKLADGSLEKKQEDGWTSELYFNESMAIYHLFFFTKDHPVPYHRRGCIKNPFAGSAAGSFCPPVYRAFAGIGNGL